MRNKNKQKTPVIVFRTLLPHLPITWGTSYEVTRDQIQKTNKRGIPCPSRGYDSAFTAEGPGSIPGRGN